MQIDLLRIKTDENLIAKGNDSSVYRTNGLVIKIYENLSRDMVGRYAAALRLANEAIPRMIYPWGILIDGIPYGVKFEAVRLDSIILDQEKPIIVAPYIPYPNLDVLTLPEEKFNDYVLTSNLTGPALPPIAKLNQMLRSERPTRVYDELIYAVDWLSRELDSALPAKGHYVGKYNAKVCLKPHEKNIVFIITDVCVYIDRMRLPPR